MRAPNTSPGGWEGEARPSGALICTADKHDTLDAYIRHLCRCPDARRQVVLSQKRYRLRKIRGEQYRLDATGTIRRVQALNALGWRNQDIAEAMGTAWSGEAVGNLRSRTYVYRPTADLIARAYDQLADHQGPSSITAARAKAKGWLVPLWWDDDTIDDPTYTPKTKETLADRRREDRAERLGEVARLTDKGMSAAEIALKLGVTQRQVVRDRMDMRAREAS